MSEQDVRRIVQEVVRDALERRFLEYLRVEEFDAYTKLDSERREKLIEGFGELRGQLAVMLKHR